MWENLAITERDDGQEQAPGGTENGAFGRADTLPRAKRQIRPEKVQVVERNLVMADAKVVMHETRQ